jgi:hypothetical protein
MLCVSVPDPYATLDDDITGGVAVVYVAEFLWQAH